MSSSDDSIRSARPLDLEGLIEQGLRQKVIYAGAEPTGQPYLIVTEDGIALVDDESNVISLNPDFGINLSGRIALACMPEQISIGGGYWRINPLVLSCIPSTSATPVPWLNKAQPRLLQSKDSLSSALSGMEASSDIGPALSGAVLPPCQSTAGRSSETVVRSS